MTAPEKTLNQLIEERERQARDRNIYEKAEAVSETLGSIFNRSARNNLVIKYKGEFGYWVDGSKLSIVFNGKTVFDAHIAMGISIDSYIPGPWEKELEGLYKQVQEIERKAREEKQRLEAERERANHLDSETEKDRVARAKWGLEESAKKTVLTAKPKLV